MSSQTFYPTLNTIINLNELPEVFSFVNNGVDYVLENLLLKQYQVVSSQEFNSVIYQLEILSYNKLKIPIFGTEMFIIINPSYDINTSQYETSFAVSLLINKGIIGLFDIVSLEMFSTEPRQAFDLLLDYLGFDEEDLISQIISTIIPDNSIMSLVTSINNSYSLSPTLSISYTGYLGEDVELLIEAIVNNDYFNQNNITPIDVLIKIYFTDSNNTDRRNFIQKVFNDFFDGDVIKGLTDLFIPKVTVTLQEINVALQFPRKWLTPIYTGEQDYPFALKEKSDLKIGDPLPETYFSQLIFDVGALSISTENGLNFDKSGAISFKDSYIGNTGLRIGFSNVKIDLSTTNNIPEATADGRSNDFRGVYIDSATIGLPAKWFKQKNGASLGIYAEKLLVGTGGMSGKIGLKALGGTNPAPVGSSLEFELGQNLTIGFKNFDVELAKGKIIHTDIQGYIKVPIRGVVQTIDIEMSFDDHGDFRITASSK